jgi:alpha-L-rhamnosidase
MKNFFCVFLALQLNACICIAQTIIQNPVCENLSNPIGLDTRFPRFSWKLVSDRRNLTQKAYEIRVSKQQATLLKGAALIWATGQVISDSSVHITYGGQPLQSGTKYYWQVRAWDNFGKTTGWSAPAYWQMGLLDTMDWKAKWISAGSLEDTVLRPSPIFIKKFRINKKISSAFAYITAHGLYETQINGKRVGDSYLTPGWTSYNKRLQYQTYDVASQLTEGENAIGITLGNGWYRGFLAWAGNKNLYGNDEAVLFQLDLRYADGTSENIVSDESWKSSLGSIKSAEIYDGEIIDARYEKTGWTKPGFDAGSWKAVAVLAYPKDNLVASTSQPIRKHEIFKPVKIFKTPKGEQLIDFGQNLVGWVQVKLSGKKGDSIRLYHAEVLDKTGNFYTENLRAAKAEDIFVLNGNGEESFEPHFTFHGFRYVKVEGYPGELNPENFRAVALYSDMPVTGSFSCSNALINQLQHNIQWGQKGNFLDVPTDCPQRDERLGWTGDAQVFSRTATFNMNVNNFFDKWLKDVAADQMSNGSVPFVVPNVLGEGGGSTGWADVATIIPWNMYLAYGDKRILEQQYNSMKAWVDFMFKNSRDNLWNTGFHFGDWLFYRPDDDNDGRAAVTDKYLIAQCFFAYSTQLLINAANVLGKKEDVARYTGQLINIKEAFVHEYLTPNGRLVSGTQTAYTLALNFDMLPESARAQAASRLAMNVRDYSNHLTTGFLGTPYLCHVLTRFGYDSIAYDLLLQDSYPSWLYPVKMGATTIWERWDGIKPDSSFETPGMNSFNHYSYGAIGDWMYRVVAGIDNYQDGAGYKKIRIMPHIGGGLTQVNAEYETYYGKIRSAWKIEDSRLVLDVEIPANTSAVIYVPALSAEAVSEGGSSLAASKDIQTGGIEKGYLVLQAGSGKYHFISSR